MAGSGNRIGRKEAVGMENLVSQFIREMKLESGINQVLHKVMLRVKVSLNLLIGREVTAIDLVSDIPLAFSLVLVAS